MKRVMTAALLCLCIAAPAMASKELAQAKNCLGCHAVDSKVVGPSFKEVAAKYAGDNTATAALATKIIAGRWCVGCHTHACQPAGERGRG